MNLKLCECEKCLNGAINGFDLLFYIPYKYSVHAKRLGFEYIHTERLHVISKQYFYDEIKDNNKILDFLRNYKGIKYIRTDVSHTFLKV